MLFNIIDSYETEVGKGLPLGNQTSQWFAIYYLDGFDRLIKEKLRIKYYSRYMDDCIILCKDKIILRYYKNILENYLNNKFKLHFNSKTQIVTMKNGVNYLGWHFYFAKNGKIIRKLKNQTKKKYKRKLKYMKKMYENEKMEFNEIKQVLSSYKGHLSHGHTYRLRKQFLSKFVLNKVNKVGL